MAQDPVESSFKDLAQRSHDQSIESCKILHLISYQIRTIKILCRISTMDALYKGWSVLSLGGRGGTPFSGLCREAPPERGAFCKLAVY